VNDIRPIIIGIGGAYSGAGKTTYASLILKRLKGWGAIKYTKTHLYSSITDDFEILSEHGKDTKKLLDSGAEKVLWVQSPVSELLNILQMAVEMLSYLKGILIEGNSAIEVLKPDLVVFISGDRAKFKKSAQNVLKMANIVIYDKEPPRGTPKGAKIFRTNEKKKCLDFISSFFKKK
jgi:molybdopterin-guanine dinucleotide biosynthesis protein